MIVPFMIIFSVRKLMTFDNQSPDPPHRLLSENQLLLVRFHVPCSCSTSPPGGTARSRVAERRLTIAVSYVNISGHVDNFGLYTKRIRFRPAVTPESSSPPSPGTYGDRPGRMNLM